MSVELVAASFIVLFQELTLIRWLPGQIRVLAYFPNLILLSAFLGLGIGCLRAGRRSLLWAWLPALTAVAAAALALSGVVFAQDSAAEHLYLLYYDLPADAPVVPDVRLPIVVFFVLSALSFVPLGQAHQDALALRRSDAVSETTAGTREGYHLPYRLLKAPPRRALVVGAGTGNDVAVLLDEGAERVDAVEIDPVILDLGRQRHPDRPYADPRVRAINTDARSFLNDTRERYDLIVFGTLDSMTRLSALSPTCGARRA